MKSKSKRIVAGIMTGFCVLSTQSILKIFQKMPRDGGNQLISYKEKGNFVSFAVDEEGLNPNDYKGTLKYKIKFENQEDYFATNTILRNAGVKKAVADEAGKTYVWAKDIKNGTLRIEGTENFFKKAGEEGASNLIRFKLKAKYGVNQSKELSLNSSTPCIEENDGKSNVKAQIGNTYQIINTSENHSKLYWGTDEDANKLIFEIPIELPEQVKVEDTDYKIESFEVSTPYMNREYIEEHAEKLDGENKSKGIEYTLKDEDGNKTAEVKKADNLSIEENVVIPKYVEDTNGNTYAVTSIGDRAFNDCSSLASVEIPDSVESIGSGAFDSCSNLTSVVIPDDVTSIGGSAFYGCSSLTSITIGNSVESIDVSAFYDCSNLTSITIKSTELSSVGSDAFDNISDSATFYVPASKVEEYKNLLGKTNVQPISE